MKKLAIITTHPIQYYAPWFRLLAERHTCIVKVFYTWSQAANTVKDRTFGKDIKWDIPLLEGYDYEFIENVSKKPGSHHFFGIDCPTLIDNIKTYQPDAILFFGWNFKSHLFAIRHFSGKIPVWFRGDSTLLDETKGFKVALRRLVLKKVYSYIDKALYVGEANKAYFLKHGLSDIQLVHVPHAIDNKRFMDDDTKSYELDAIQWRKELGYSSDDIVVLFAGKFETKKQPDVLIKAITKVNASKVHPLKLLLVGNGPLEAALKTLAENDSNIQFLPFQNQTRMPLVYRLGAVFCLPSKGPGETWGLAVNEAMACSRPVIVSTKVGCAEDLVFHNENGFVFDCNSDKELQAIIEKLSMDNLLKLGNNAQKITQIYNFEAIVLAIEQEFATL